MKQVMLFAGTRKGGLIFTSDESRQKWEPSPLHFKAWNVMHMSLDPRDNRLHVAGAHDVFGPSTHYSDDWGQTWTQSAKSPVFERPSASGRPPGTVEDAFNPENIKDKPESVIKVWHIAPGRADEPGVLYAGVQPAALFKSTDHGETWQLNEGFYDHPHRGTFFPGAGGLCLHTIILHPTDHNQMWIAVSTGGCYYTDDGGQTWSPRNKNVLADFSPDKYPEYGQCVHKMVMHPSHPGLLYQQNHCGMYRSEDGGLNWIDIGEGKLPSRFGFPIAVHPHDANTVYIVPEEADQYRVSVDGKFVIWRTRDRGETWEPLTNGLPRQAHLLSLREAMATDTCTDAGIYVGTSTGQIFYTRDGGDRWELLADYLPPVLSLEAAVVDM
jgi:hypothetical protein